MDIQNLATPEVKTTNTKYIYLIIVCLAIGSGFWLSRLSLGKKEPVTSNSPKNTEIVSQVTNKDQIQVGKTYGTVEARYKDTATGVLEAGNINGEGTHILVREGGLSQRASLTSSVLDLDMFVGHKIEIKGETNASNKTSWLMEVGVVKVLE
ncbi:MAG TPA: hypothetical protein PK370_00370 [Candidatus Woesebacteria bacterium]|nr:hypothetical protein [Candidatus Woesebacteria bacterium]HPJ16963.1 hypothetical protein [Candidatus Woesebacteria bacterium]